MTQVTTKEEALARCEAIADEATTKLRELFEEFNELSKKFKLGLSLGEEGGMTDLIEEIGYDAGWSMSSLHC